VGGPFPGAGPAVRAWYRPSGLVAVGAMASVGRHGCDVDVMSLTGTR